MCVGISSLPNLLGVYINANLLAYNLPEPFYGIGLPFTMLRFYGAL